MEESKTTSVKKNIFVDKVSRLNWPILKTYSVFGFQIYYLKLSKEINNFQWFKKLEDSGFKVLNYEDFNTMSFPHSMNICNEFIETVEKKILNQSLVLKIAKIKGFDKKYKNEFDFYIKNEFSSLSNSQTYDFSRLLAFLNLQLEKNPSSKNFLYCKNDYFTRTHLLCSSIKTKNLQSRFMTITQLMINSVRLAKSVFFRQKRPVAKQAIDIDNNLKSKKQSNLKEAEIAYFPHKGIRYAELFLKDQFYSNAKSSKFYKENIYHLCFGQGDAPDRISINYYDKHNIPYGNISSFFGSGKKKILKEVFQFTIKNFGLIFSTLMKRGLLFTSFCMRVFYYLSLRDLQFSYFSKLKVVLVGYDILFPIDAIITLKKRGIKTVATQERFIAPYWYNTRLIYDYFFCIGGKTLEYLKVNKDRFLFEKIIPIDFFRLKSIEVDLEKDKKYLDIKKNYTLILAADFEIANTKWQNQFVIDDGYWNVTHKFYRDLLTLVKENPQIYIVIKRKTNAIHEIDEFKEIIKEIESEERIEFEKNLSYFSPYKMINLIDAGIIMYSQFGDEILASGKPAFIYDFINAPSPFENYDHSPFIVRDFKTLSTTINDYAENNSKYIELAKKFKSEFYKIPQDINSLEVIQEELESLNETSL